MQLLVRRSGGFCEVRVLDDGAGLAADTTDGVGITNSRERLRHAFGERAELRLQRRSDSAGTEVRVCWPVETGPPV